MKRMQVLKCKQAGMTSYMLVEDARKIIALVDIPEKGKDQEAQRPWKEKRVKDIAAWVAKGHGLRKGQPKRGVLPTCPVINIKSPLKVESDGDRHYVLLPDTIEEVKRAREQKAVEILDGQHRLISFSADYIDPTLKDDEDYQMGFVVFENLTLHERKEVFLISNEKAEKVDEDVLRHIKRWLGLLLNDEEKMYDLVTLLSKEVDSPLRGRIVIGGNKVTSGLKLTQIGKILQKSKSFELLKDDVDTNTQFRILSNYLKGWSGAYPEAFADRKHPLNKIAGFRYMMYLFPSIVKILDKKDKKLTDNEVRVILERLRAGVLPLEFFTDDKTKLVLRGETAIVAIAKEHSSWLERTVLAEGQTRSCFNI